jgi:hypothetical protein
MKNNRGGYESTKRVEDLAPPPKGKGDYSPDQTKRRGSNRHLKVTRVSLAPCPFLDDGEKHRLFTHEVLRDGEPFPETYCTACLRTTVDLDAELNDQYRTKPKDVGEV